MRSSTPSSPATSRARWLLPVACALLWRTWARWLGTVPIAAGLLLMLSARPPDVLGDRRWTSCRHSDSGGRYGTIARKSGYVRDTLSDSAGYDRELLASPGMALRQARCSEDLCAVTVTQRQEHVARTDHAQSEYGGRACARKRMRRGRYRHQRTVVARTCLPRWLKIDKTMLRRTGGVAIDLKNGSVRTVRSSGHLDRGHALKEPLDCGSLISVGIDAAIMRRADPC